MQKREIKFRYWDGSKMHYQGSFQFDQDGQNNHKSFFPFEGIESGEICVGDGLRNGVITQFTGLVDCENKPIYEGDILEYISVKGDEICGPVKWHRYEMGIGDIPCWCASPIALIPNRFGTPLENFKVIGNEYENKELLKDAKRDKV